MLLQNPFEFAASDAAADKAAASISLPLALDVAAASFDSDVHTVSMTDEPAAPLRQVDGAAVDFLSLTDCIAEIFVGARKLEQIPGIFDQAGITPADELRYVTLKLMDKPGTRDLPDVPQGLIEAMEPMPLFLLRTG